jgi:hypothetical protein
MPMAEVAGALLVVRVSQWPRARAVRGGTRRVTTTDNVHPPTRNASREARVGLSCYSRLRDRVAEEMCKSALHERAEESEPAACVAINREGVPVAQTRCGGAI